MADSQSSSTAAATPPHASAPNGEASTPEENAAVENGSQAGFRPPETRRVSITFGRTSWSPGADATAIHRDDKWSCFAVIFSFWFFVSVTLILGVYGSMIVVLGPESSIAFQPSPLFVQYVKVENLDAKPGPILYGTYQYPPLDVVATWGENRNVSLPSGSHKEWRYFLNRGSEVNISYRLIPESSSVFLVIAEGTEGLSVWLENPTQPNTTLSWNVIQGTGIITQKIFSSTSYYIALGNLDEEVEVELNLSVRAFLHNTTNAYYKCSLTSSPCSLNILFPNGNAAVLVSPGPQQARLSSYTRFKEIGLLINLKGDTSFNGQPNILNTSNNEWYVKLSYGPRWMTYIFGIGGLTLLLFWAFDYLNKLHCAHEDRAGVGSEGNGPQREPLLSRKDDDLSSWGSSYDSLSQDEEDLDFHTGDGETSNNTRRLCAICFDAPRDCFFLPCGHCAACFACGTRIAEAAGTCPVCRRNMKKVRKIFTV